MDKSFLVRHSVSRQSTGRHFLGHSLGRRFMADIQCMGKSSIGRNSIGRHFVGRHFVGRQFIRARHASQASCTITRLYRSPNLNLDSSAVKTMNKTLVRVSRDFRPPVFYDSNPSGPLINKLKYFWIQFRFCRDIWSQGCFRSVEIITFSYQIEKIY